MCAILHILAQNTVSVEIQLASVITIELIDPFSNSIKRYFLPLKV